MNLQLIQDAKGNNTGVYIPIEDWTLIKHQYPEIENANNELEQWEKDLIDNRLEQISQNPDRIHSGKKLLSALKEKI